jgi:hypothetical protein
MWVASEARWLLKAISVVEESNSHGKEKYKWVRRSTKYEKIWRS